MPGSLTTTSRPGSEVRGGSGCRLLPGAQPAEPSGGHSEPAGAGLANCPVRATVHTALREAEAWPGPAPCSPAPAAEHAHF